MQRWVVQLEARTGIGAIYLESLVVLWRIHLTSAPLRRTDVIRPEAWQFHEPAQSRGLGDVLP